jgi:hypothetical protein
MRNLRDAPKFRRTRARAPRSTAVSLRLSPRGARRRARVLCGRSATCFDGAGGAYGASRAPIRRASRPSPVQAPDTRGDRTAGRPSTRNAVRTGTTRRARFRRDAPRSAASPCPGVRAGRLTSSVALPASRAGIPSLNENETRDIDLAPSGHRTKEAGGSNAQVSPSPAKLCRKGLPGGTGASPPACSNRAAVSPDRPPSVYVSRLAADGTRRTQSEHSPNGARPG